MTTRRGRVLGYVRASTDEQRDTLLAQQEAIRREYDYRYATAGYEWGGCFVDAGVSGGGPLGNRPQGMRLCAEAQAGDVIVITKLDRGFRSTRDFLEQLARWEHKGVALRLLD